MARLALTVVGAVAGAVLIPGVGAALGAQIGALAGSLAGALLFPDKPPAPKLGDIRVQDSGYGAVIPRVYGMYRVAGNVIWAGQPQTHTQSGKGGGKGPGQITVNMSFAVALCEGPINGIRRIWANGKLVYDISNPSNFQQISGSNQMVTNFKVYNGDENQLPDPTMEAALGIGNVPAHRGLAYVVFNSLDLSPWGNYLPSFSFEVVTGVAPSYVEAQMANYSFSPSQDMTQIGGLSAQGATMMGIGYLGHYNGLNVSQLTPYGSTFTNPYGPSANFLPTDTPGWVGGAVGWSDEPGILCPDATYGVWTWYKPDGTWLYGVAGLPSGVGGVGRSFIKSGYTLYATCNYGGGNNAIQKCTLVPSGQPFQQTGALLATSTVTKPFMLVGLTSAYVYAIDGSTGDIYQFDANTLSQTGYWASSSLGVGWLGGIMTGQAIDDRHIYLYASGRLAVFDAVAGVLTLLGSGFASSPTTMQVISPGYIVLGTAGNTGGSLTFLQLAFPTTGDVSIPLSTVVADICTRAGLSPSQYDVSQLTGPVLGYAITQNSAPRDALVPLMSAYMFDVTDSDGKLKFVKRGGAVAGSFAYADLGASNSVGDPQNETPIEISRSQESDLPKSLALTYIGAHNDYAQVTQTAFRTATSSNKESAAQLAVVMTDDVALQKAQSNLWSAWLSREQFSFCTTLAYLKYEPNDVVTLQGNGVSYTVRLTNCKYDAQGVLKWTAVGELPAVYTSTAAGGAPSGFAQQSVAYGGPTLLDILDVPPLRDTDTTVGLYMAAAGYSPAWPGCIVEISRDGVSYTDLIAIAQASTLGTVTAPLSAFAGGNQPDELSAMTVSLANGSLSSVSYANFLAGTNAAYVGGEIVYFRNASLISANTYQLTGFVRGVAGTDWAIGMHSAGEKFVFLDPSKLSIVGLSIRDVGTKLSFEARLANLNGGHPGLPQSLTPVIARVQPLAPVLFKALPGSASSTTDISLSWIRRARVYAAWNNGADVPLDQQTESYQLTISTAAGVIVRTVTVTAAQSYVYTAANITADGFTTGNTINFSVAQNSDLGVIGRAATTSIVR